MNPCSHTHQRIPFDPTMGRLFPMGLVVATAGALEMLNARHLSPMRFLARHQLGDWGDLGPYDRKANDQALAIGARILSSYRIDDTTRLWIITEADRLHTTLLLPEEY